MTEAQAVALEQIRTLLNQNFDAWVLATRDTDDMSLSQMNSYWGGSLDSVVGLSHITAVRLDKIIIDNTGTIEPFKP